LAEGFAGVHRHIEANATFDERVATLPDPARSHLLDNPTDPASGRLVDLAAGDDPKGALVGIVVDIPGWLADSSGVMLVAAAELAGPTA